MPKYARTTPYCPSLLLHCGEGMLMDWQDALGGPIPTFIATSGVSIVTLLLSVWLAGCVCLCVSARLTACLAGGRAICLSGCVCLFVCILSLCVSVCRPACLPACLFACDMCIAMVMVVVVVIVISSSL